MNPPLPKTDQVYVWRKLYGLIPYYQHHGIVCGNGTIIQFVDPRNKKAGPFLLVFPPVALPGEDHDYHW
jgi:hypothetical protein